MAAEAQVAERVMRSRRRPADTKSQMLQRRTLAAAKRHVRMVAICDLWLASKSADIAI
jgi:hypothetical protein